MPAAAQSSAARAGLFLGGHRVEETKEEIPQLDLSGPPRVGVMGLSFAVLALVALPLLAVPLLATAATVEAWTRPAEATRRSGRRLSPS